MKKKTLGLALFFCFAFVAGIEAQEQMVVNFLDGSPSKTFNLADFGKMTFGDSKFQVKGLFGQTEIAYENVKSIKLANLTVDGIAQTEAIVEKLNVSATNGTLIVHGIRKGHLRIYSASGQLYYANPDWRGQNISLSGMAKGMYIIKINNKTAKFYNV